MNAFLAFVCGWGAATLFFTAVLAFREHWITGQRR